MFEEKSLREFVEMVASSSPTPGGGAVGAYAASLGSALLEMVANLTLGKKGYENKEAEMEVIVEKMKLEREKFLALIDEDVKAFNEVMKALRMPKNTEEEKRKRGEKLQEALKKAADVPYELMRLTVGVIEDAPFLYKYGNKNAISDVESACEMLRAAFYIGKANVEINLKSIKDEEFIERMKQEMEELEGRLRYCLERINEE